MTTAQAIHRDALPVCPERPVWNPNRLVSLWRIVNRFELFGIAGFLTQLTAKMIGSHMTNRLGTAPLIILDVETYKDFKSELERGRNLCEAAGFEESKSKIDLTIAYLEGIRNNINVTIVGSEARNIYEVLMREIEKRQFLQVVPDRFDFVDNENIFGESVSNSFPSATADIKEAGNCLAAECPTAAVFHLMRAAEFALRALAKDRQVAFADKPLEQKEWGQILPALESKIKELRARSAKDWTSQIIREQQIRFYNDIVQELRSFNEAWRRHLSHADVSAFYDREQASSIMKHVKALMQKLSGRISEVSVTPMLWN